VRWTRCSRPTCLVAEDRTYQTGTRGVEGGGGIGNLRAEALRGARLVGMRGKSPVSIQGGPGEYIRRGKSGPLRRKSSPT
jgi:hypothetical protein